MRLLSHLTELADAEAANIIFEWNPAGGATAIHFYKAGQLVDDYYAEHLDADETYENLIELPQHPELIASMLNGRFAFLLAQPKRSSYDDGEEDVDLYFDGEDLSVHTPEYDTFNLRDSDLYVPFWNETIFPIGAVYCFNGKFPDFFLKRYEPNKPHSILDAPRGILQVNERRLRAALREDRQGRGGDALLHMARDAHP